MENVLLDRPTVSEAVVDMGDEPFDLEPSSETPARFHPYVIPIALVVFAAAMILTAFLAGIPVAKAGS